jgi:hypothetical protein
MVGLELERLEYVPDTLARWITRLTATGFRSIFNVQLLQQSGQVGGLDGLENVKIR